MNRESKNVSILLFVVLLALQVSAFTDADYKEALELSTKFFGANRCGPGVDSWIGHDSCHWYDGDDNGVDLTGGWHDCGDHPKFGETGGYAAMILLHGYVSFPDSYPDNYSPSMSAGGPNGIPDVLDEVKYYTDYALKMLKGDDFYFQVGTAYDDHKSCSTPKYQTTSEPSKGGQNSRPSYKVSGGGASNIAGLHSATLSLMYLAYKEHDESYANKCKDMAIKLYEFGDKNHSAVSSKGGSAPYTDTTWADDMALAAALLKRVTDDNKYTTAAIGFMGDKNYNNVPTYFVLDYPTVSPIVQYEMGKNVIKKTSYKTPLAVEASIYIDSMTSAGFAFFGYNDTAWGSLKYASAASYVAMLAYDLFPDSTQYKKFAQDNIDFILGDHGNISNGAPSGFSFLVGFGSSYPDGQVHHAGAFGRAPGYFGAGSGQWGDWNTSNNKTLTGALVGGPILRNGGYENYRNNAYTNEVCIYYNAPLVSTFGAWFGVDQNDDPLPPSNITLSKKSVIADKSDELVGAITVTDPNSSDTHTLTITSGGDKFKVSGKDLLTKTALSVGTEKVTIKATDQTGLFKEVEFTITVTEEAEGDQNVAGWLGWYVYVDEFGSTVDTGSALVQSDSIATATFTMVTDNTDKEEYVAGGLGSKLATPLADPSYIIIEYKASENFNFVLPTKGIDPNSGKSYFCELTKATSWTTDTLNLNDTDFSQPSWVTDKTAFDKSESDGFDISPAFQGKSGKIEVRAMYIEGFDSGMVPIAHEKVVTTQSAIKINSLTAKELKLTVPEAGYYKMQVYSLNGRKLGSITSRLTEGMNSVGWMDASYFGSNVVIFHMTGMGRSFSQKLIIQ